MHQHARARPGAATQHGDGAHAHTPGKSTLVGEAHAAAPAHRSAFEGAAWEDVPPEHAGHAHGAAPAHRSALEGHAHGAAPAHRSAFEGHAWEDVSPEHAQVDIHDVNDVNAIEAAAAGTSHGDDDALDALDARDAATASSAAHPHGKHAHGKDAHAHGNDAHGKHAQGNDAHGKHAQGNDAHGKHAHEPEPDKGSGIHIITRAGLRHLRHGGRKGRHAAQVLYNNPEAFIVLKEGQTMPRGWKAKATILFPSYTEFEAAHRAGRIPRFIDAVVYDNEHWDKTPRYEKTGAVHYAKLFGELAQKLHLVYIAAPTQKWFAADARFADIIDLQLQGRENHVNAYARAVRHDVKLAHHLNPHIKVVGQISSNRNHLDPDHSGNIGTGIHHAERDVVQNAPYLDGFWGYLYQQNHRSVKAGQKILTDLAAKHDHGVDL